MSMRARRLLSVLAAIVPAAGCGQGRIDLSTDQDGPVAANGVTTVELTADVSGLQDSGRVVVSFRAGVPLLFPRREDAIPDYEGLRQVGSDEIDVEVRDGIARVYLLAPIEEATLEVEASVSPERDRDPVTDRIEVKFGPPPLVSAGDMVGDTPAAVVPNFLFECAADNIGAFVTPRPDIVVPCSAVLRDHAGRTIPHVPLHFDVEAGRIVDLPADPTAPRQFFYLAPSLLDRRPADVAPFPAEEPFTIPGAGLTPGAAEQNPRDGLVTILVVARGHEAYTDGNGNGDWDPGEPYIDEGEPFLDVDDDGIHDPAIDGPHCCDENGNHRVDGPNGVWDGDTLLGRTAHILWSGPVAEESGRSGFTPADPSIDAGASADITMTVVDANFNPVAMFDSSDGIRIELDGPVELFPPPDLELDPGVGLGLRDRFPFFVFGDEGGPIAGPILLDLARRWQLTARDRRSASGQCVETDWTLEAQVEHTPGPSVSSSAMPSLRDELVVSGVLDVASGCP
jgi:hypothetical protein